jgi:hypothetical protein
MRPTHETLIATIKNNPNVSYRRIAEFYGYKENTVAKLAARYGIVRRVSMKNVQSDTKTLFGRNRINSTVAAIIRNIRQSNHPSITLEVIAGWTGVSVATVYQYTKDITHTNRMDRPITISAKGRKFETAPKSMKNQKELEA